MGIKEDILRAGSQLLRERGVTALTQPQIAEAAGIKQSHLTYYFPKRVDLLFAIAEFTMTTLIDSVAEQLQDKPQTGTLPDIITHIMTDGFPPRVFIGLIVAADADPDIRKLLRKLIRHVRAAIQRLMEQAGMDANKDAALIFHAAIIGLAVMHQARLNKESTTEVHDGISLMTRMLTPKRTKRVMK